MKAKEITDLFKMMPGMVHSDMVQDIASQILKEHRTNQASIIRTMQNILQVVSQSQPRTDMRNAATIEFAHEVSKIECPIPYI